MSDQTLKPCPFCGHAAQTVVSFGEPVAGCVNGVCDLCDTEWLDEEAWNTRPVEDALRAENDRLRAAIEAAVDALPRWSKGALEHLSPAEIAADEVRMSLREALASPVEGA